MSDEWKLPNEFERIKELNAHAGRLATAVSVLIAASSLSVGQDVFRDAFKLPLWQIGGFVVTLVVIALSLWLALTSSVGALHPPIMGPTDDRSLWEGLVRKKLKDCTAAILFVQSAALLLGVAWIEAPLLQFVPSPFNWVIAWLLGAVSLGWFLWAYSRYGDRPSWSVHGE